jgi:sulfur carrier protein
MNVLLNGEPITIGDHCTVKQLLQQRRLNDSPCAVEVNRKLVPRREHEEHALSEGDEIEIVTLVGGG